MTCSRAPQTSMVRTAAETCQACSNASMQRAATAIATYNPATNDAPCAEHREPFGQGCGHNYLKLCARTQQPNDSAASNGDTTTPGFSAARPSTDDLRRPASSSTNAAYALRRVPATCLTPLVVGAALGLRLFRIPTRPPAEVTFPAAR